jgi:hypothetical protein
MLSQRGGVVYLLRWGAVWMTWPFCRLTVFQDRFEVNRARFTVQNVRTLERVPGLFWRGLRIVYVSPATSKEKEVIFWSPNFELLQAMLAQAGFNISKSSRQWWRRQFVAWAVTVAVSIVLVTLAFLVWGPEMLPRN